MAFFTIHSAPDLGRKGIEQTADFLGLVKVGEAAYQAPNGNRLQLIHDQKGYSLEPVSPAEPSHP